jgi:hypothetical protein
LYSSVEIDLKKVKNLTLVKDVKNLAAPLSHNLPILVLDCPDRSLYLQSSAEKVRKKYVLYLMQFHEFFKATFSVSISGIMDELFVQKKCQTVASVKYDSSISHFFYLKETMTLKETIENVAFSNTNSLNDQQLTSEDIPVIVDKSISFVYGHGCMTEGIYR